MTNGLVQHIAVEESTGIQWVKGYVFLIPVYPSYQRMMVYITLIDINDNAPLFNYPVYPVVSTLTSRDFYITALSLFSDTAATGLRITVSLTGDNNS